MRYTDSPIWLSQIKKGSFVYISIILSIILSVFSTVVMSYISMAIGIGPWIAPTLVLISLILFRLIGMNGESTKKIALIASAGSVGGILATAFGFSFPTLYFLQPSTYSLWLAQPSYFIGIVTGLAIAGGSFGLALANIFERKLLIEEQLSFPIGQLVYKMISVGTHLRKAYELLLGFVGTIIFCFLQDGIRLMKGVIPEQVMLLPSWQWRSFLFPGLPFRLWPMAWAIGFIAGHMITIPLLVGAVAQFVLVKPINSAFFDYLQEVEFTFAFCSGMVLYGALISFIDLPKALQQLWHKWQAHRPEKNGISFGGADFAELLLSILISFAFLWYCGFSLLAILFLLLFTAVFTYQIMVIAGKIGLAPLGRFATFVMIPAMFLFNLDKIQIVLVATFVEACGGVAADVLFGRKTAQLAQIPPKQVKAYQYLGLLVSALSIGAIFWTITSSIQLGSEQLFAYKAQSRQLLIDAKQFNAFVLLIGALFSCFLQFIRVNPILVLGGLLMPLTLSVALIFGGLLSFLVKDREEWEPLWSGVFAANSVWMMVRALW